MLDLGTLRIGVKVDSGEAKSQLNDVAGSVEGTGVKVADLAAKAKTMIKAFAAAWAVKELVKLGKAALDAYAEFEQLEGGVKKLFGDSSDEIMKYADRAYQTAGISANEYMKQATSFSASLIQSLNGDTEKAAKITDMAIRDMSDNANTFGTDIGSIQNAYQGFAKQNYTMLDNLKLGYGGTKEEMERLLEDAEKLSGQEYDISNLNDVYEAIHVVQEEMNITGTTSTEAATTIDGSTRQMKASWENLLTAMGSGEGVNKATDQFLQSLGTMAQNIIPRVIQIAGSIVLSLVQAIPQLMQNLATAISNFADTIGSKASNKYASAGLKIVLSLIKGILKAIPQLLLAIGKLALNIVKKFGEIDLWQIGKDIINSLLRGLQAAWTALKRWVSDKAGWIRRMFNNAKESGNTSGAAPSQRRIGLREVPYDGYTATLHKGETILTAAEANRYQEMLNGGGGQTINGGSVTVNVYGSDGMSVSQLASAVEQKLIQMQKRRTLAWQ